MSNVPRLMKLVLEVEEDGSLSIFSVRPHPHVVDGIVHSDLTNEEYEARNRRCLDDLEVHLASVPLVES